MKNKPLLLASKSPRRKTILEECEIPFICDSKEIVETIDPEQSIEHAIEQIAYQKACIMKPDYPEYVILGCDTMVILEDTPLGKPKNREDAKRMLLALSGKTHRVVSGVAILYQDKQLLFHETTQVSFYPLEEAFLTDYLDSEEPYDKAGAYGIQGKGKLMVKEIRGDYFNVMGLPASRIYQELKKL